jgi:hypothetical protein
VVEAERPGPLEFLQVLELVERSLAANGEAEDHSRSRLRIVDEDWTNSPAGSRARDAPLLRQ